MQVNGQVCQKAFHPCETLFYSQGKNIFIEIAVAISARGFTLSSRFGKTTMANGVVFRLLLAWG
jgi:hypothetical protein